MQWKRDKYCPAGNRTPAFQHVRRKAGVKGRKRKRR
jgi:hypothetical protein